MKRALLALVISVAAVRAADTAWLDRVEPLMSASERKVYLSLQPEARRQFEQDFWKDKGIDAGEYFRRIAYVDSTFGSNRPGSGANTDQGRVYLALGPPARMTRLPSSRVFVPIEIWYYDSVPGVVSSELRLIFFQKGNTGYPKLYSPVVDTIRGLLLPTSSTRSMFGPNDSATEADIRAILKPRPGEDEVISASAAVATGVKDVGNEEILGHISSPREMLGKAPAGEVRSRLIVGRPKLDFLLAPSPFGGSQVDLRLEARVRHDVDIEVIEGPATVYQNHLHLEFSDVQAVTYTHRLDLLPGSYRLVFTLDGTAYPYPLEIPAQTGMGEIGRAEGASASSARRTPFEFDGMQLALNPDGPFAYVALDRPGPVTWLLRQGTQAVWKFTVEGKQVAMVELPAKMAPGVYRLEASAAGDARGTELVVRPEQAPATEGALVSFNANLAPASRYAFVGHQWLLRGKVEAARRSLEASLGKGSTAEAQVELARADAMAGNLDAARSRVRRVLAGNPKHFEALAVFAYIETKLQDYDVAAELYRRALAVQDSPALRAALAQLPAR